MEFINLTQNTPEWDEYRISHYNASETPAVMGISPFQNNSPEGVARVKKGLVKVFYNNAMKRGHELEPIMQKYAEELTNEILEPCVGRKEGTKFSASFDGITFDHKLISEYKASKHTYNYVIDHNKAPENYYMQVQHQLMVSGANTCLFVVINPETMDKAHLIIEYDAEAHRKIVKAWDNFDEIMDSVQAEDGERVDSEWLSLSAEYIDLLDEEKRIKARLEDIKSDLSKLSDNKKASGGGITFSPVKGRKKIDYEKAVEYYLSPDEMNKYLVVDYKTAADSIVKEKLEEFTTYGSDSFKVTVK